MCYNILDIRENPNWTKENVLNVIAISDVYLHDIIVRTCTFIMEMPANMHFYVQIYVWKYLNYKY